MNKEKLIEACSIIEKVIIEVSGLYNSKETTEYQKALLETMIGAAIWYLPTSDKLYSKYISLEALEAVKSGTPINKLTQEHKFPRKQAGKLLLKEKYKLFIEKRATLCDLYLEEFGQFNLVVKRENRELIKYQKDDEHTIAYEKAGIKMKKMEIEEIKSHLPLKIKSSRKSKTRNETPIIDNQDLLADTTVTLEMQVPSAETPEGRIASFDDKGVFTQIKEGLNTTNEIYLNEESGSQSSGIEIGNLSF